MPLCVAGMGNMFGETNLRLHMDKHEELKVVETELWDRFLQYMYTLIFFLVPRIPEICI